MSLDPCPDAATLLAMKAERDARHDAQRERRKGAPRHDPAPQAPEGADGPGRATDAARDARLEKQIVADADRRMRALGFTVWNLSQPRASKLSPGIPDRLYTCPARGLAVYWEAKAPGGRQRPDQRVFQEHADATGLHYVLGGDDALDAWLRARGIALSPAA